MAKVNTTLCKARWCRQRPQALYSEGLGSNSNLTTYCVTLSKLLKFSNFYFPIDKIEKISGRTFVRQNNRDPVQFSKYYSVPSGL